MKLPPKIRAKTFLVALALSLGAMISTSPAFSQNDKGKEGRGREEQLEKQKEKKEEAKKAQEEAKEKHMEMQSDRTKRDLKKLNRRSDRWNRGRREFFLVRWYKKIRYKIRASGGP